MSNPYYMNEFSEYVCIGDTITRTIGDTVYTARVEQDIETRPDTDYDIYTDGQLNAWRNDEWSFVVVVISAERDGWTKDYISSLCGIEANMPNLEINCADYLTEVAHELMMEASKE